MSFENIAYTSTIFWHFVRGWGKDFEREENSLNLLTEKILGEDGDGKLLAIPPEREGFHERTLSLERGMVLADIDSLANLNSMNTPEKGEEYKLKEPRAICFADIPINSLPIHINHYFGIGLGFRKEALIDNVDNLKPVDYYPRKTIFALKNACVDFKDDERDFTLQDYAKIPSEEETFEQIYHEREWRTFGNFEFTSKELAMIFFPSRKILNIALKDKKIKALLDSGVGFIAGEDLYQPRRGVLNAKR